MLEGCCQHPAPSYLGCRTASPWKTLLKANSLSNICTAHLPLSPFPLRFSAAGIEVGRLPVIPVRGYKWSEPGAATTGNYPPAEGSSAGEASWKSHSPTGAEPKDNMGDATGTKTLISDAFRVVMGHHMGSTTVLAGSHPFQPNLACLSHHKNGLFKPSLGTLEMGRLWHHQGTSTPFGFTGRRATGFSGHRYL